MTKGDVVNITVHYGLPVVLKLIKDKDKCEVIIDRKVRDFFEPLAYKLLELLNIDRDQVNWKIQ